jgi:hypothetical protein
LTPLKPQYSPFLGVECVEIQLLILITPSRDLPSFLGVHFVRLLIWKSGDVKGSEKTKINAFMGSFFQGAKIERKIRARLVELMVLVYKPRRASIARI